MVSEDGTVKLVELELKAMLPPPDPLRVTLHAVAEAGPTVAGLHAIVLISELAEEPPARAWLFAKSHSAWR